MAHEYDVVVIGAGPAGSYAAGRIAARGYRVAVLEEHQEIGEPVQCGGLVAPRVFDLVDARHTVLHKVSGADIYSPAGHKLAIDGGGTEAVVVDRPVFDREVARIAAHQGAELHLQTLALGATRDNGGVTVRAVRASEEVTYRANILIGADGVKSGVARWFRILRPKRILPGFEAEVVGPGGMDPHVKIFVGNEVAPGFFGWIIPNGETSTVGVCVTEGNAREYCEALWTKGPSARLLKGTSPIRLVTGAIPMAYPERTYADRVMIVGDAACQAKATSGGGIYTGLVCAGHAADAAAMALESDDASAATLAAYQRAWEKELGKELKRAWQIHKVFSQLTDEQFEEILRLLDQPDILELINREADIDFPSQIGVKLLAKEPRLARFLVPALLDMLRETDDLAEAYNE